MMMITDLQLHSCPCMNQCFGPHRYCLLLMPLQFDSLCLYNPWCHALQKKKGTGFITGTNIYIPKRTPTVTNHYLLTQKYVMMKMKTTIMIMM